MEIVQIKKIVDTIGYHKFPVQDFSEKPHQFAINFSENF
jgi:hypothetical protein